MIVRAAPRAKARLSAHRLAHRQLVGSERTQVITARPRQLTGQYVGAEHRKAGAAADGGPGLEPPASPTSVTRRREKSVQPQLTDRVEVKRWGVVDLGQPPVHLGGHTR